jgi:hypothetical protein
LRILFFSFLFSFFNVQSQPPDVFYVKFGGSEKDVGHSLREIPNRQYILAGMTASFGAGLSDAYIILIDSMGQALWEKTFGGGQIDVANCVLYNETDSGFVFTGYTGSKGEGGYDLWAVRLSKEGNIIYDKTFGTTQWEYGNDCAFTKDGNVVICGFADNAKYGSTDGFIVKFDLETGAEIWRKIYGGPEYDEFNRIQIKANGNLLIAGNTQSYGDLNNDMWIVEIDGMTGDSISSAAIGTPDKGEVAYDFIIDKDSNIVFAGSFDTSAANSGKNVSYIHKIGQDFQHINDTTYDGKGDQEHFTSLVQPLSYNEYVLARTVYSPGNSSDLEILRLNFNYYFVDAKDHGDLYRDEGHKIIATSDGGYAVVGYRSDMVTGVEDLYFLKLDPSLSFAPIVLHTDEIEKRKSFGYFFGNSIYINSDIPNGASYVLLDVFGNEIKKGVIQDAVIIIPEELSTGIYICVLEKNRAQKLKFLFSTH